MVAQTNHQVRITLLFHLGPNFGSFQPVPAISAYFCEFQLVDIFRLVLNLLINAKRFYLFNFNSNYLNRATHHNSSHFVSSLSNLTFFSSSFLLHFVLSVLYIFLVVSPFVYSITLHFFSLSFVFWHVCSNFLVLWATPRD